MKAPFTLTNIQRPDLGITNARSLPLLPRVGRHLGNRESDCPYIAERSDEISIYFGLAFRDNVPSKATGNLTTTGQSMYTCPVSLQSS